MKTCTKCRESKELTEFTPKAAAYDGLSSQCKVCRRVHSNKHSIEHYAALQATCTTTHKPCSKCKVDQPLTNYTKAARTPDGRGQVCNVCLKEVNRLKYLKRKQKVLGPVPQ